jgi:hypothetical protein
MSGGVLGPPHIEAALAALSLGGASAGGALPADPARESALLIALAALTAKGDDQAAALREGLREITAQGAAQAAAQGAAQAAVFREGLREIMAQGAAQAAAQGAAQAAILTQLAALGTTLATVVRESKETSCVFSAAKFSRVMEAQRALSITIHGSLVLPALPAAGDFFAPFVWDRTAGGEVAASPTLRGLLERWVALDKVPPDHALIDVQGLAAHHPLRLTVGGVGTFSGVPDAVFCHRGVRTALDAAPLELSALVSVDWKQPAAMSDVRAITAIGRIQAMAFADAGRVVPVFFTDLAGGFRGWLVVEGCLFSLHPPERDLTLAEGVALIRLFLDRATAGEDVRVVDGVLVFGVGAGVEGAGGGREVGSGSAGGGGAAPPRRSQRAPGSSDHGPGARAGGGTAADACGSASGDDGDGDGDSPDTIFVRSATRWAGVFGVQVEFGGFGRDEE